MSRKLSKSLLDSSTPDDPQNDVCPVCKSNRYLNRDLQFLINPECYHKMCSTCVDRLFTSGPAPCPVINCGKTLRKKGFHKAFFADLKVERECDIRKRVGSVFNRRQEEFETLGDWNDYLEEVEGIVFDIVEGSNKERAAAERKLNAYREGNLKDIEENRRQGIEEAEIERRREQAEKEARRQRALAMKREEEEEKLDIRKSQRDVLERLANSNGDANQITKQAQKVILKKSSARRNVAETAEESYSARDSLAFRGLKKKQAPAEEKPYDPFGGLNFTPSRYVLQEDYHNEWLGNAKSDLRHMAGGYNLHEYYTRTMFEAFSGLGVFIEDEVADRPQAHASPTIKTEPPMKMIKVEVKMESDDVF
jgi:CDK-activating kinase assembly factor MAT1